MTPKNLRKSRDRLGLSAEEFARAVGASSGRTVRRWESGERSIPGPVKMLVFLAERLPTARRELLRRAKII